MNLPILFIFDRHKLNRRGVIFRPVEYYGTDDGTGTGRYMGSSREAEERMFYDKPVVSNIIPAIKEIRVFIEKRNLNDGHTAYLRKLIIAAKKNSIPIKMFTEDNRMGYFHGREKEEDRKLIFTTLGTKVDGPRGARIMEMYRTKITKKKSLHYSGDWIDILEEYVRKESYKELTARARSRISGSYHIDFADMYRNDIHNFRTDTIEYKQRLDKLLKLTKSKTIREFFNKLNDKWNAILNKI